MADAKGDYLLEDKSQLGGIIDFKKVPRRESDRQQARRDLVITMLIAESMSKWDKLYRRVKNEDKARKRANAARALRDNFHNNRISLIHDVSNYYGRVRCKVRNNLGNQLQPCLGKVGGGVGGGGKKLSSYFLDDACSSMNLYIWWRVWNSNNILELKEYNLLLETNLMMFIFI